MTAQPPDPDPQHTPGLDDGGGVRPGDTPPESGATSGLSHEEDGPHKPMSAAHLVLIVVSVLAVAGIFGAFVVNLLG